MPNLTKYVIYRSSHTTTIVAIFIPICQRNDTVQNMKFSIKDLVTLNEEILNGEPHFLRNVTCYRLI